MAISCSHGGRAPDALEGVIHHSQGGSGRHRCVVCAYVAGLEGRTTPGSSSSETCEQGSQAPAELLARLQKSQGGVGRHGCAACAYVFGVRRRAAEISVMDDLAAAAEVASVPGLEGARRTVSATIYERDPALRAACIDHYGVSCQICGLDFERRYGAIGSGFIHVHHLRPLSGVGEQHHVDPVADLLPVCANCHAMLHRQTEASSPRTPDELRSMLR